MDPRLRGRVQQQQPFPNPAGSATPPPPPLQPVQQSYPQVQAPYQQQQQQPNGFNHNGYPGNTGGPIAGPSTFPSVEMGTAGPAALELEKKESALAVRKTFCVVCASNNVRLFSILPRLVLACHVLLSCFHRVRCNRTGQWRGTRFSSTPLLLLSPYVSVQTS